MSTLSTLSTLCRVHLPLFATVPGIAFVVVLAFVLGVVVRLLRLNREMSPVVIVAEVCAGILTFIFSYRLGDSLCYGAAWFDGYEMLIGIIVLFGVALYAGKMLGARVVHRRINRRQRDALRQGRAARLRDHLPDGGQRPSRPS